MKRLPMVLCAVFAVSCARVGSSPAIPGNAGAVTDMRALGSAKFTHVFSFNGRDGKEPSATLIAVGGALYGTTYAGGAHDEGTVFKLTRSGAETVLHSFKGGSDGALPLASVTNVNGTLYGTTAEGGGPNGEGIVFKIKSGGTEIVVHRFGAVHDGANPYAGLIDLNGTLYGTTAGGGRASDGTVFTITPSGKESVLYSFSSGRGDGATPVAPLISVKHALYGTTEFGGGHCATAGCGAVFEITPSGRENVVYGFKGGNDGSMPQAPLIELNGTLYGTTAAGGTANEGTVFKVTTAGSERVIYSFQGGADGAVPQSLIASNGTLYGTTAAGGSKNLGTIFAMTTRGKKTTLYSFRGGTDGATPRAGLVDVYGTLYGTTAVGGSKAGTVYGIKP